MGRYTGPVCRLCRQVGEKLFLKGERCFTPKCGVERRRTPPGQKANSRRRHRVSEAGLRLREKQKARYTYGILERQFSRYFQEALGRPGVTGQYLIQLLERRLDNAVYRLNFADSRRQAREMVREGHIVVNGKKVSIPSFIVKPGDTVGWKESSQQKDFVQVLTKGIPKRPVPEWLSLDSVGLTGKVLAVPQPADMDLELDTRLIVEYYSR